jgi:hypothetical protein
MTKPLPKKRITINIGVYRQGIELYRHRQIKVLPEHLEFINAFVGWLGESIQKKLPENEYFAWDYERTICRP